MKKKLTVNTVAFGNLRQRKKQYVLIIISIILAMVFVSGVPFFLSCLSSSQEEMRLRRFGKQSFICLNAEEGYLSQAENLIDKEVGYCKVTSFVYPENGDETKGALLGYLDKKGKELYYQTLLEGRLPENKNEIAVERTTLLRLGVNIKAGDSITLSVKDYTEDGLSLLSQKKTFTVTGILYDKQLYLENLHSGAYEKAKRVPAVFLADAESINISEPGSLIAFVESSKNHPYFSYEMSPGNIIDTTEINASSASDPYYKMLKSVGVLIFLSILLALLSCFTIINALNSDFKERKNQIGLLKAVGATRRQIVNIFGREAFIIALFCAPVSVLISYFTVKLIAHIAGEGFIFIPDFPVLLAGAFFGIVTVMAAALIPLIKISVLPPLQAIRDIEMLRRVRNKKISSQKSFSVPLLLAKRKGIFSRGKRILISLILTLTVFICMLAGSVIKLSAEETDYTYSYDYEISDPDADDELSYSHNSYVNMPYEAPVNENMRQLCYDIPYVENVYGKKTVRANMLIDGELPDYLLINDIYSIKTSVKYPEARSILSGIVREDRDRDKKTDNTGKYLEAVFNSPENTVNPYYNEIKEKAGYTEEIFNTVITAESDMLIKELENNVIDGEINLEKLNSGEEIIIRAPDEIGLSMEIPENDDEGYMTRMENMAYKNSPELSKDDKKSFDDVILIAKCPYKAGDRIKISILEDDGNGNYKRTDKEYTIGAVVGKGRYDGIFGLITTIQGLDTLSVERPYAALEIKLSDECTAETDEFIMSKLKALFPGKYITSAFLMNESNKSDRQTLIVSLVSMILVFSVICVSLIANTVTADIRENKKTIGTLRAVGYSERELFSSYLYQTGDMLLWGTVFGAVIYIISYAVINNMIVTYTHFPFTITPLLILIPALFLILIINLKVKLRRITDLSIVENIREL